MTDPFMITGPALVSFSGGRTSAFMLWRILQAHGGTLPADVVVTFANTGKERPETLRFVHECATRWAVPVVWLEWTAAAPGFVEVGFNSASRSGEPFSALISKKGYLPNAVTRFCTLELKVRVMKHFAQRGLGWKRWANVVGLRHDEGHRCLKAYARNAANKEPFVTVLPLDKGRISRADVAAFWEAQPFDLGLRHYEGNCDLCFLKGRKKLTNIIRERPGVEKWWITQEDGRTATFVTEHSYRQLAGEVDRQPHLFDEVDDFEHDVECGDLCAPDEALTTRQRRGSRRR